MNKDFLICSTFVYVHVIFIIYYQYFLFFLYVNISKFRKICVMQCAYVFT